jgi:hypothetical protein
MAPSDGKRAASDGQGAERARKMADTVARRAATCAARMSGAWWVADAVAEAAARATRRAVEKPGSPAGLQSRDASRRGA